MRKVILAVVAFAALTGAPAAAMASTSSGVVLYHPNPHYGMVPLPHYGMSPNPHYG